MVKVISENSPLALERAVNDFLSDAKDCKIIGYNVIAESMQNPGAYMNPAFNLKYSCMILHKSLT